jgi:hypothetical protein
MALLSPETAVPPSCSEWARSQGLDPAGTAGHYRGFVLVEQPLPWPADASLVAELTDVSKVAAEAGFRVQLIVPVNGPGLADQDKFSLAGQANGERRIVCYRPSREGWAGELVRSETAAPTSELAAAVAGMVSDGVRPVPALAGTVVDVLVCAHGRRDACCGSRGTRLANDLVAQPLNAKDRVVRLWRTSHTGGHRFSPTAVVLPAATLWAYADRELLQAAVGAGTGPAGRAANHYRGCATLGPSPAQALERAVFAEVGWRLFAEERRSMATGGDRLRLETRNCGTWEGTVKEGRRVPQPECRTDPAAATKHGVEWAVVDLRRLS